MKQQIFVALKHMSIKQTDHDKHQTANENIEQPQITTDNSKCAFKSQPAQSVSRSDAGVLHTPPPHVKFNSHVSPLVFGSYGALKVGGGLYVGDSNSGAAHNQQNLHYQAYAGGYDTLKAPYGYS